MFHGQKELAVSFHAEAMEDYVAACEQAVDLYLEHKLPEREELIRAQTRLRAAYDKLKMVVKIANKKFGTTFQLPHLLFDPQWCKKVQ